MKPIEVVNELNDKIHKELGYDDTMLFSYHKAGEYEWIEFGDNLQKMFLWDNDDSIQDWDEEANEYEPLDKCLKRRIKQVIKQFNSTRKIL